MQVGSEGDNDSSGPHTTGVWELMSYPLAHSYVQDSTPNVMTDPAAQFAMGEDRLSGRVPIVHVTAKIIQENKSFILII